MGIRFPACATSPHLVWPLLMLTQVRLRLSSCYSVCCICVGMRGGA